VALTPDGAALLRKLDVVEEEWEQTLKNLSETEAQQLNDLLDKLRGNKQTEE
jgi:DNA-binding MarR family transcriptional regulator